MRAITRSLLTGVGMLVVALVAACGGPKEPDVTFTVDEYRITMRPPTTDSAGVRFDVDNVGDMNHELIAIATDAPPDALPTGADGTVDLAQVEVADRLEPFTPGWFEATFPQLRQGRYVMVCNLVDADGVSHYQKGMRLAVDITQSPLDAPPEES